MMLGGVAACFATALAIRAWAFDIQGQRSGNVLINWGIDSAQTIKDSRSVFPSISSAPIPLCHLFLRSSDLLGVAMIWAWGGSLQHRWYRRRGSGSSAGEPRRFPPLDELRFKSVVNQPACSLTSPASPPENRTLMADSPLPRIAGPSTRPRQSPRLEPKRKGPSAGTGAGCDQRDVHLHFVLAGPRAARAVRPLASTAYYYIGGIVESANRQGSALVHFRCDDLQLRRSEHLYRELRDVRPRRSVFAIVKEAMGGRGLARLAVVLRCCSTTILTGPISGVTAGQLLHRPIERPVRAGAPKSPLGWSTKNGLSAAIANPGDRLTFWGA